jgi:hypothetical protein
MLITSENRSNAHRENPDNMKAVNIWRGYDLIIYGVKNNSDLGCLPFSKKPNLQVVDGTMHSFVQSPENYFVLKVVQGSEYTSMVLDEFIPCIQQLKEENKLHLRYNKLVAQQQKFDDILEQFGELNEEEEAKLRVIQNKIINTYSIFLGKGYPPLWFLLNADMSGKNNVFVCVVFFFKTTVVNGNRDTPSPVPSLHFKPGPIVSAVHRSCLWFCFATSYSSHNLYFCVPFFLD